MQLRKLALLGLFGAGTAAPTPAVLESTAAALKPEAKEALADNMAESVMSFLVWHACACVCLSCPRNGAPRRKRVLYCRARVGRDPRDVKPSVPARPPVTGGGARTSDF